MVSGAIPLLITERDNDAPLLIAFQNFRAHAVL